MVMRYTAKSSFCLHDLQELVRKGAWNYMNTRRTYRHLDDLDWGEEHVIRVLLALEPTDFEKTVPNCKVHERWCPEDLVLADQYCIPWDLENHCRAPDHVAYPFALSIKLSLVKESNGDLTGVVTFHPSGTSW